MPFDALGSGSARKAPVSRFAAATVRRAPYRAVFISDLHLGTPGCRAEALLDFLKEHPSDYLYLVGNIVDGRQLQRKWYWPQTHNDVVQKIMRKARKGCRVVFVPGQHDLFARQFDGLHFGGIEVRGEAVHATAAGQRLWVVHGDAFDADAQDARQPPGLGDNSPLGVTQRLHQSVRRLGRRCALACGFLSNPQARADHGSADPVDAFENTMAGEARRRGHDGVVCGHIRRAQMRRIGGTLYCNDGDWVDSQSALLEHRDGRLELRQWPPAPEWRGAHTASRVAA